MSELTVRNVIETYARRLAEAYPDHRAEIIEERDEILVRLGLGDEPPSIDPKDKICSNCSHPRREHFPACLHTMSQTTNEWGGGTTTLCGCGGGPLFFK